MTISILGHRNMKGDYARTALSGVKVCAFVTDKLDAVLPSACRFCAQYKLPGSREKKAAHPTT